jgi:hypothetical protein
MKYIGAATLAIAATTLGLAAASTSNASQGPNIKVLIARTCTDSSGVLLVYYNVLEQAGPKTWIPMQDKGYVQNTQFVHTDRPGGEGVRRTTTQVRVVYDDGRIKAYSPFVTPSGGACG